MKITRQDAKKSIFLASWRFELLESLDGASLIATVVDSPILTHRKTGFSGEEARL
jgi:hypothetical protein